MTKKIKVKEGTDDLDEWTQVISEMPTRERTPRQYGDFEPFVEAIERNYSKIQSDYKNKRKVEHWSWFLFPLVKTNERPRAGTEPFYLIDNKEVPYFFKNKKLTHYYTEFLHHLHQIVIRGMRDKRPMTSEQSLKYWLQPVDYDKFITHVNSFRKYAPVRIKRLYNDILGKQGGNVNSWIKHVKDYATTNGISYREALQHAKSSYKR